MTPLFDVDLEKVAQIVERRAALSQHALLLDRGRLGVSLGHDQAPQRVAVLARNVLPDRLPQQVPEADLAIRDRVGQDDPPAKLRHVNEVVVRPAVGGHRDRGPQIDVPGLKSLGPHVHPPGEEVGLPLLQRPLQLLVLGEVNVMLGIFSSVDGGRHWGPFLA